MTKHNRKRLYQMMINLLFSGFQFWCSAEQGVTLRHKQLPLFRNQIHFDSGGLRQQKAIHATRSVQYTWLLLLIFFFLWETHIKVAQLVPVAVIYCSCTLNSLLFLVTFFIHLKHWFLCYSRKITILHEYGRIYLFKHNFFG